MQLPDINCGACGYQGQPDHEVDDVWCPQCGRRYDVGVVFSIDEFGQPVRQVRIVANPRHPKHEPTLANGISPETREPITTPIPLVWLPVLEALVAQIEAL